MNRDLFFLINPPDRLAPSIGYPLTQSKTSPYILPQIVLGRALLAAGVFASIELINQPMLSDGSKAAEGWLLVILQRGGVR